MHYSAEKVILNFLNRVYYCEFTYENTWADNICMCPFVFVLHDILHGILSAHYCPKNDTYLNFFKYVIKEKGNSLSINDFMKIKNYMYLQIHELDVQQYSPRCALNPYTLISKEMMYDHFIIRLGEEHALYKLLPRGVRFTFKEYSELNVEEQQIVKDRLTNYFQECIDQYRETFSTFQSTRGGSRRKRKRPFKKSRRI